MFGRGRRPCQGGYYDYQSLRCVKIFLKHIVTSSSQRGSSSTAPRWFALVVGRRPRRNPSHTEFKGTKDSTALEALGVGVSAGGASLSVDPSCVVSDEDRHQNEADVYCIPVKTNQVGIDSFILHDNNLYLFQMTVFDVPGINDNLFSLLSLKRLPPQRDWRFTVVKPPPAPDRAEL